MRTLLLITASLIVLLTSTSFGQQLTKIQQKVFKEKFFVAENMVLAENYTAALNILFELKSMDSMNYNVRWKIGICFIHSGGKKVGAIPFLEAAAKHISANYAYDDHTEREAPPQALRDLAHAYHLDYQLDTAIAVYRLFLNYLDEKQVIETAETYRQIKMCQTAKEAKLNPVNVIITNLGGNVNSGAGEHSPVITGDESLIMFTSRRKESTGGKLAEDGKFYEDIYVSYKEAGVWSEVVPIDVNINSDGHEATIGLSVDGQTLFIYKDDDGNGNIYRSELMGESWSKPKKMSSNINSEAWETNAVITADGRTLYFVSDREGGVGGRDIYSCKMLPNGSWSKATNLGSTVNTQYDEDAPFMHPDGIQLLFSSNGHESMGGFDIFSSELGEEGIWTRPENIGYPINTTDDDMFYITSVDGKRAYYAANKPGGFGEQDLYMISLAEAEEKKLTVLTGVIADQFGNIPGSAEIIVTDNETGELFGIYNPNSTTGKYLLILPQGKNYNISFESDGLLHHSENLFVAENSAYAEINKAIELSTIRIGKAIVLNNMFFEHDKTNILIESKVELDKLYKLMTNMPNMIVEISVHTDAKGKHDYNMKLSQGRAQA
ncbi:MAG: PD40 domain-containing protein, partial [Flavobacteriales bacterium]|nr:PD40 domain-containing protein [Flavobacteriales bacterium]